MQDSTLLLRQVHPQWFKDGHIVSLAFRPTAKDSGLLSVYDGDRIVPRAAWNHYTTVLGLKSAGVWAVSVGEVSASNLSARPDPQQDFSEHSVIDFSALTKKQQEAQSKVLATFAEERGCLHVPSV